MMPNNHHPAQPGLYKRSLKYRLSHISIGELARLLETALEAQVGPFRGELITPRLLTWWFVRTREGFNWLYRYLEYPLPPWPEALGRAAAHVDGIESAHRCLRGYNGGTQRFYIFKQHEYWRQASPTEITEQLCLDESRII